jgi:hypothetical protein
MVLNWRDFDGSWRSWRRRGWRVVIGRTCPIWSVILANAGLELAELVRIDVEHPFEIAAHLALHLIYFSQRKHALANDRPALVRVRVVAHHFAGNHKRRDEETVARRTPRSGEARLEAREQK